MAKTGQKLYKHAKKLIPGGVQLLSKRPEMFSPEHWPAYYSKAKGSKVWDLDGKKYLDISIMGVGACILGYADEDVDQAVIAAIKSGITSTLNCPEEVKLAEVLLELHPWFDMLRYARTGGEAMAIAVRIARAKTGREVILFSGYHGWSDWYLSANLSNSKNLDGQLMPGLAPAGVPRGLAGTAIPFEANEIDNLKDLVKGKEDKIAAIIIEPARGEEASVKYLTELKEVAAEINAVLIFDEITSGFRMGPGGIHRQYGVHPDLAVFAKSIGNGYPISVIMGVETVMQAAQSTFISSTNWTDRIGTVAAIATIDKYCKNKVEKRIISTGELVKRIWQSTAKKHNIDLKISGLPSLPSFTIESELSGHIYAKVVDELLDRQILGFRQFKPSFAHCSKDIDAYAKAINEVFEALSNLDHDELLSSPEAHMGFHRLTRE